MRSSGSRAECGSYAPLIVNHFDACACACTCHAPFSSSLALVLLFEHLMHICAGEGALSVIEFVREIVETYPDMRKGAVAKLRDVAGLWWWW